ncbi:MAG: hypothetical protein U5M51_09750 [Emticicia sp.]|nr:hypothetical protein [Emticicia sp.]
MAQKQKTPVNTRMYYKANFNANSSEPFRQRFTRIGPAPPLSRWSAFDYIFVGVQTNLPPEPVSKDPTPPLEYKVRGLTWHTVAITNSCHIDSFLSAFIRQVRMTNGAILKHIMCADKVGGALLKIAEHVLVHHNNLDSHLIKKIWLEAIGFKVDARTNDIRGNEDCSIYQHLYGHSGLVVRTVCRCGFQYLSTPFLKIDDFQTASELFLQRFDGYNHLPLCLNCGERRMFERLLTVKGNWMVVLSFNYMELKDLADVTTYYILNHEVYRLSHLSFCLSNPNYELDHIVSLHFIRQNWYLYDSAKSASFKLWTKPITDLEDAYLKSAVYFRVP